MPLAQPGPHAPAVIPRRTLARPVTVAGVTLFTAKHATLTIRPATQGHGIVFRRIDLPGSPEIPATVESVEQEPRHTVLRSRTGEARVHTVEHVLSALAGMGVTDAVLDLEGPELPIGDGSANLFADPIAAAGVVGTPEAAPAQPLVIARPIRIDMGGSVIEATPPVPGGETRLELEYHLDYSTMPGGGALGKQTARMVVDWETGSGEAYRANVAPARTFSLLHEAQAARKMGLFQHLQPKDLLVIGPDGEPVDNVLRFPDEPARHKLLDLLGDLYLVGRPLVGGVVASRSGHAVNHAMARALVAGVVRAV